MGSQRRIHFTRLAGILSLVVLVQGLSLPSADPADPKIIRIKGAHTLAKAVDDLGKAFRQERPDSVVVVSGGGTTTAYTAFLNKEVEIAMAVREMNPKELEAAAKKGLEPLKKAMANDGVAIIVNRNNPIPDLSVDQVGRIFKGELKNWKEVGGPDRPIDVIIASKKHGTHGFFKKHLLKGEEYTPKALIIQKWRDIIKVTKSRPHAIAFCITNKALAAGDLIKVLPIRKNAESPPVRLSRETMDDKTYPITRPAYFVWDKNASPIVQRFIDFCSRNGVKVR